MVYRRFMLLRRCPPIADQGCSILRIIARSVIHRGNAPIRVIKDVAHCQTAHPHAGHHAGSGTPQVVGACIGDASDRTCAFKCLPVASQRPLWGPRSAESVYTTALQPGQNLERLRRKWHAMALPIFGGGGRQGPPTLVDVVPPDADDLTDTLSGEGAELKEDPPRRV